MKNSQIQSEIDVVLDGIRSLYRKQQRIALYKLIYQTHPAVSIGTFVTTSIDILGISIYIFTAQLFLEF